VNAKEVAVMRWTACVLLAVAGSVFGCEKITYACPGSLNRAITLHVRDGLTGASISGANVSATFNDYPLEFPSVTGTQDPSTFGIFGDGGEYELTTRKSGYIDVVQHVSVEGDSRCHKPTLVELTVYMFAAR
jgi:hypothetical protein